MAVGNAYMNENYRCLAQLEDRIGGDSRVQDTVVTELETFVWDEPAGYPAGISLKSFHPVFEDIGKAILGPSYGLDNVFNRVWVRPVLYDLGFITEQVDGTIQIWNAWLERSVEFTSVIVTAQDGTFLDYPSLPYTITQSNSLICDLTIYKEGPPMQETRYRLVIDGDSYNVDITGIRVIGIIPDIQWADSPSIEYSFYTVMYQDAKRFEEQRRPLVEYPNRKINVPYLLVGNEAHGFFNIISYGHDKIFGVPIYNEKMIPSSISVGSKIIQLTTSTQYMYNLKNNCKFIILIDHDAGFAEIKEIDSISANQIDVVTDVIETFSVARTFVYPMLLSLVRAVSFNEVSDDIETISVDFAEFIV